MITVRTLHELKALQDVTEPVYVSGIKKMYVMIEGEWIERVYYTTKEIASILNCHQRQVQNAIRKLNIKPKIFRSSKMNYDQLVLIAQAVKMKRGNRQLAYEKIKIKLGI